MATVTKDFRIKSGLVVEGANGTINGSDIITEDALTGGTQNNITVSYNPSTKAVDFSVDALSIDTNGPLSYNAGVLDLTTSDGLGIDTANNGLKVALYESAGSGSGLEFSGGALRVDTGDGLTIGGSGELNVSTGDGLEISSGQVAAKLAPTSGLAIDTASNNGIKVNTGYTTTITNDQVEVLYGPGLTTSSPFGLVVNAGDGLAINYSNNTVDAKLAPTSGLMIDTASNLGLKIDTGDGLELDSASGKIQAKLAPSSGLAIDTASNLGLKVDTDVIATKQYVSDEIGSISSTLDISAGGSTGDIILGQETLSFSGSNGISASLAQNNITIQANLGSGLETVNGQIAVDTDVIASRSYVDSAISGLTWKPAVNLLANTNVNLTTPVSWPATPGIDGHAEPTEPYRVLLTAQTNDSENGIWVYDPTIPATWTRAADADVYTELDGAAVFVMEGDQYGSTSWVQSNHYLTDFTNQEWDQFAGQGSYTAGNGLEINGNEFSIDDAVVVTHTDLDGYLNSTDGTTYVALTDYADALVAAGDPTATPTYLALDINSVAKQVAATVTTGQGATTVYEFDASEYRSAKFLVKMEYSTHTQVSEVLLTLDTSNNIAITEYAIVGTNGNLGEISATYVPAATPFPALVQLKVTPIASMDITVVGTLLA